MDTTDIRMLAKSLRMLGKMELTRALRGISAPAFPARIASSSAPRFRGNLRRELQTEDESGRAGLDGRRWPHAERLADAQRV